MSESVSDPIIGTWKLNIPKSKYPSNKNPSREITEIYRMINGGRIGFTYEAVQADGSKSLFKAIWPAKGGAISTSECQLAPGKSYVETLLSPGKWRTGASKD
jgi:hypothetical protein